MPRDDDVSGGYGGWGGGGDDRGDDRGESPPPVPSYEPTPPAAVPSITPYAEAIRDVRAGRSYIPDNRATSAPGVTDAGATWAQVTGGRGYSFGDGYSPPDDRAGADNQVAPVNPYNYDLEEIFGQKAAKKEADEMFVPGLVGISQTQGFFGFRDKARFDPQSGVYGVKTEWGLGNFIADALSTAIGFFVGGVPGMIAGKVVGQIVNTAVDDDITTAQAVEGVFGAGTTRAPAPDSVGHGNDGYGAFQTADGGVFGVQANAAAVPSSLDPLPGEAPGVFDLSDDVASVPDTAGVVGAEAGGSAGTGLAGLMLVAAAALEVAG